MTNPSSTVGSISTIENWGTDTCSSQHYAQGGFAAALDTVPGVTTYASCGLTCQLATPTCPRGVYSDRPLRFALPTSHTDVTGSSSFTPVFSSLASLSPPVYAVGVGVEYSTLSSLSSRRSDVVLLDSSQAYLGYRKYNYTFVAVEEVVDARTASSVTSRTAQMAVWIKSSSVSTTTTYASLRGLRVCGGSLLTSSILSGLSYGLMNSATTTMTYDTSSASLTNTSLGQTWWSCRSPIAYVTNSFFLSQSSCLPSISLGQLGICGGCPGACSASSSPFSYTSYSSHIGAIRGLVEGICDVAFSRDLSYEDACGSGAVTPIGNSTAAIGAQSWCPTSSSSSSSSITKMTSFSLPSMSTGGYMVRPSTLTSSIMSSLGLAIRNISISPSLATTLLPLIGVKAIGSLSTPGSYADTTTHFTTTNTNNVLSYLPGFTETVADLDVPWLVSPPQCSEVVATGLGLSIEHPIKVRLLTITTMYTNHF